MSQTLEPTDTSSLPWHLRGNWAPVLDELSTTELRVEGKIPTELDGLYVRTGPNPASGTSVHWFFGDGMLHGVRLRNGRAEWYRNRFVKTPNITDPLEGEFAGMGDMTRGKGNTHVLPHNGKLMALEEAHWPWLIDGELNTIGYENYGGALTCSMTAHPKICPETGELLAFSYMAFEPPYVHYVRISPDGKLVQIEGVDIPAMVMMHDFNVTRNKVVFMDLPLVFDLNQLDSGVPFKFNRDNGARLGVMGREDKGSDIKWFDIDPCYVFHPVNAHDDGDNVVLYVSRQPEAFGASSDDYAQVGRLWKWTIDTKAGKVTEEQVDDRPGDFGRVNDAYVGLKARYGYLMSLAGEGNSEEPVYGSSLWKYDLTTGQCWEHHLGATTRGSEPVFAPSRAGGAEDEGYVMTIVHDIATNQSRLVILDAQNFSAPPLATVYLPQRVPYGAHGSWVPATSVAM
ncbi:MAG: dioxygenase [Actinobacteria bacterium]|nr:dioxygenase [Actinomycetota bacterium]